MGSIFSLMLVTFICTGLFSKDEVTSSDLIIKNESDFSNFDLYSSKVFNRTNVSLPSVLVSTQSPKLS